MIRIRGRRDWIRHHPLAKRIAADLLRFDGLLNLRTRLLQRDVMAVHGVSQSTAAHAVAMARKVQA